ncbi:caspase family protein, partial [Duganella vulcania]
AVPPGDPAGLALTPLGAGALAPIAGIALFDEGQALAIASGKRLTMWDATTGHPRYAWSTNETIQALAGNTALGRYAVGEAQGAVTVRSAAHGELLYRGEFGGDDLRLAFSPQGHQLAVGRGSVFFSPGTPRLSLLTFADPHDPATAKVRDLPDIKQDVQALAYSSDGLTLASGHMNLDNDPAPRATLKLLDSRSGAERPSPFAATRSAVQGLAYAPASPLLAIASAESLLQAGRNFLLWDAGAGQLRHTDPDRHFNNNVAVSPDGKLVALSALLSDDAALTLWDAARGRRLAALPGHSARVAALAFNGDHQLLSGSEDGTVRLWRMPAAPPAVLTPQATLVNFRGNADWLVGAADGQFDTSNLDRLNALAWIFPDDPLRAFPAEIFTRALYRPGLLGRLLACAGKPGCDLPAPPTRIDALNRVQPEVALTAVRPGRTPDEVLVEVRVSGRSDPSQRNGQTQTDAYDLRLFRDGKLVGQWPPPASAGTGDTGLDAWRQATRVPDGSHVFPVRLPRSSPRRPLELSAYAFNRDRVKSATVRWSGALPAPAGAPAAPRAYVLTVGVNAYDDPALTLQFAAKDARDMSAALSRFQDYEVVRLSLLSDHPHGDVAAVRQATKANVRDVLALLAGDGGDARARLRAVPDIDQAALARFAGATPDDLVIVTFSSHGYADAGGQFYLLPSDTGHHGGPAPLDRERLISSTDLSLWLRQVDAGHMALIIDACHAGGFVDAAGFRPGPLGDAGFGQLAYDKGMMILAATQASDVALEVGQLRQGLLTYALVNAGLAPDRRTPSRLAADTDGDGGLTLREWLNYGAQQVPALYAAIRSRTLALDPARRDPSVDPERWLEQLARKGQTPALFDFQQGGDDPVLLPPRP